MKKIRGFLLKHRVITLYRCIFRRRRSPGTYRRLDSPQTLKSNLSKLFSWGQSVKTKAKAICSKKPGRGYVRPGQEPGPEKTGSVPKGHMAVYVGQKEGDFSRVLVPVIYFNHPLFGQLLREAEEEFGFHHPGGITIPCRVSEFENVKTRIAAGSRGRKMLAWK
ncbi:hypothetical protein LguiA_010277 [Lonicera macranthoides]